MKTHNIILLILITGMLSCKKSHTQPVETGRFAKTPISVKMETAIPEASGIADSKTNPGYLWVEEDSGNPSRIWLLSHDGKTVKTIPIEGADNMDWEDMVVAPGPVQDKNYLYLGDIGDNNAIRNISVLYRFEEPLISAVKVSVYDKIAFRYPDGSHDAEAFLVDPATKDIYIITKRDDSSGIYMLPYPQDTALVNNALPVHNLPYNGVVSAAMSPDNQEIIVKTYTTLYYYTKKATERIDATLARTPVTLDYQPEAQGEAITFAADNSGFYTLSERRYAIEPTLNYYKRN